MSKKPSSAASAVDRLLSDHTARILVAWQPGSDSEPLEFAAWLARTSKVRIRVVGTAVRLWPTKIGGKYKSWRKKQAAAHAKAVTKALNDVDLDEKYWDNDVAVFVDGPSEASLILEAAADYRADLILMGSEPKAPSGRFFASPTVDTLLHSSPLPIGLVPRRAKLSKRGVTRVNLAFIEANNDNWTECTQLSAGFADRWDVPLRLVAFSPTGLSGGTIDLSDKLADTWTEQAYAMLDRACDSVMDSFPDLTVTTALGSGTGWTGAVDSLKWKKGDLMVLGSHPLGPLERVFVGSTAAEFLRTVPVPVIVQPLQGN